MNLTEQIQLALTAVGEKEMSTRIEMIRGLLETALWLSKQWDDEK